MSVTSCNKLIKSNFDVYGFDKIKKIKFSKTEILFSQLNQRL